MLIFNRSFFKMIQSFFWLVSCVLSWSLFWTLDPWSCQHSGWQLQPFVPRPQDASPSLTDATQTWGDLFQRDESSPQVPFSSTSRSLLAEIVNLCIKVWWYYWHLNFSADNTNLFHKGKQIWFSDQVMIHKTISITTNDLNK